MNLFKALTIVSLAAIMVVYNNCGSPFGSPSPLFFESNVYGGSASASYEAFERTVYPLTRTNCISCHDTQTPTHAADDVKEAHDSIIANFKVNFENIPSSRMVKKLRDDQHNCWGDCNSNANEMEDAIAEWKESIKDTGTTPTVDTRVYISESNALKDEFANPLNGTRLNVAVLNLDTAVLTPPMVKMTNAVDGPFLTVPDDGSNVTLVSNNPTAGLATINFISRQNSANYRIWGLVKATTTNDNAFYTNILTTASGVKEFEVPVTVGFEWRQLLNTTFNLPAGNHQFQLRERKDGTQIKNIVITADNAFSAITAAEMTGITLTYDLADKVGVPGVTFKIDLMDYDAYSYKFQNPRIVTTAGVNIKVKNIRLMVNKSYNPQHSTFTLVNKVATQADGKLSDYSMLVIKDKGIALDKISFSFETLAIDNGVVDDPALIASQQSFMATVYPISVNNCAGCHTTQNPKHALADYKAAHDVVVTESVVNFINIGQSKLITKVQAGHNCGAPANCAAIAAQYQAAIATWKLSRP